MNDLERPLPTTFRPEQGCHIAYNSRHCVIVRQINLGLFLIEDLGTEERMHAKIGEFGPWTDSAPSELRKIPDLAAIPDDKRAIGLERLEVIKGLFALKYRTRDDVAEAAKQLELGTSHVYALMTKLRREGSWTCLVPHVEKGRPRRKRLPSLVEELIQEAIDRVYMDRHNAPMAEVVREAVRLCTRAGQAPPAPNTVKNRIQAQDARSVVAARRGEKAARDKFGMVLGARDEARLPLQSVQIDHTVMDCFVVDDSTGQSVGRPILTLAIDEFSRAVLGFHLSLRPPSTLSVALALTNAVLLKEAFLRQHQIASPWEMYGLMDQILTDNAAEFDSAGLIAGCAQYGINGAFRPLGRPHFGGRIERLIGTMMGRVKLMPGATMRSIAERGEEYDPEKEAAYTLLEAQTRLGVEICDVYHRSVHSATGVTPLKLWEFGILGDDRTPGRGTPALPADPHRFLLDFLPLQERTVQEYGIQINHIRYHAPVLRAFCTGKRGGQKHIVRYDPRDLTQIHFYDGETAEYHAIPRANSHFSPVALWEVKAALRELRAQGRDPDDEQVVQSAIERMRELDAALIHKSKKARRNTELRRLDAQERKRPMPAAPLPSGVVPPPEQLPAALEPRKRARPISDIEEW